MSYGSISREMQDAMFGGIPAPSCIRVIREIVNAFTAGNVVKVHELTQSEAALNLINCRDLENYFINESSQALDDLEFMTLMMNSLNSKQRSLFEPTSLYLVSSSRLKNVDAWVELCANSGGITLKTLSPKFKSHRDIVKRLLRRGDFKDATGFHDDHEFIEKATRDFAGSLGYASEMTKQDKSLVKRLVKITPIAFLFASSKLKKDEDFLCVVGAINEAALQFASPAVYKKYGYKQPSQSPAAFSKPKCVEVRKNLMHSLTILRFKDKLEVTIDKQDETEEEARARRKRQSGM